MDILRKNCLRSLSDGSTKRLASVIVAQRFVGPFLRYA